MIILLMLLYSVLASSGYLDFNSDEPSTPKPVAKLNRTIVKKYIPKQTNYITKKIDKCPDVGYFFRRELPSPNSQALGLCLLCFCKENGTAVCWPRDNRKCDSEHYHHHGIGKRYVGEQQLRSRRSLSSIASLFLKDATKGVFNKQAPETCKPHEGSYSEGCPPDDWCLGCTVCDCNADGHWDCHLLSFCSDDDKKNKKSKRKKFNLQKYINAAGKTRIDPDQANSEQAQLEAQKLAKLISRVGEKQARKLNGQLPKRKQTIKNFNEIISSFKPRKVHVKQNLSDLEAVSNPAWIRKESVKKSKGKVVLIQRRTQPKKESINKDDVNYLANLHRKKKYHVTEKPKTTSTKTNTPRTTYTMSYRRTTYTPRSPKPHRKSSDYSNQFVTKASKPHKRSKDKPIFVTKSPKPQRQTNDKPKFVKKDIKKSVRRTMTTTTATTTKATTTKHPKIDKRAIVYRGKTLDERKIIEHIKHKFSDKLFGEMEKVVLKSAKAEDYAKKIKRSPPLVKRLNIKRSLSTLRNDTSVKLVPKSVKRSSKISVDKSNRIKFHRNRRSVRNIEILATNIPKLSPGDDISVKLLRVLPRTTRQNANATTESPSSYYKYSVTAKITTLSENHLVNVTNNNATPKRSVIGQVEGLPNFKVLEINKHNKTVTNVTEDNKTVKVTEPLNVLNNNTKKLPFITQADTLDENIRPIEIKTNTSDITNIINKNLGEQRFNKFTPKPIQHSITPKTTELVNITDINSTILFDEGISFQTLSPDWLDDKLVLNITDAKTEPQNLRPIAIENVEMVTETVEPYKQTKNEDLTIITKQSDASKNILINVTNTVTNINQNESGINEPKLSVTSDNLLVAVADINNKSILEKIILPSKAPQLEIINTTFVINITDDNSSDDDKSLEVPNVKFTEVKEKAVTVKSTQPKTNINDPRNDSNIKMNVDIVTIKTELNGTFNESDSKHFKVERLNSSKVVIGHTANNKRLLSNITENSNVALKDNDSFLEDIQVHVPKSRLKNTILKAQKESAVVNAKNKSIAKHINMTTNETFSQQDAAEKSLIIVKGNYENKFMKFLNNLSTDTPISLKESKDSIILKETNKTLNQAISLVTVKDGGVKSTSTSTDLNLVHTNEPINNAKYKKDENIKSVDQDLSHKIKNSLRDLSAIHEAIITKTLPKVETYLKYKIDESISAAKLSKQKINKRKKGKKYSHKLHRNDKKEIQPEIAKPKINIDELLKKQIDQTFTPLPSKDALNLVDINDKSYYHNEDTETKPNVITEALSNDTADISNTIKTYPNSKLPKNKVNSYDIKKINVASKRHRIKKIVTTLCNKPGKDERIYIHSEYDPTKRPKAKSDSKNLFKKFLSSLIPKKGFKNGAKANQFKIIKYLQKFFKKMFSHGNDLQNKKDNNKNTIIETLCETFGPCDVETINKLTLQSQIERLNSETDRMLSSIKSIKSLLRQINFGKNDQQLTGTLSEHKAFKADLQKLHAILKNTYMDEMLLEKLTHTQLMQIDQVKNNTKVFMQAAADFTVTLNEVIDIIAVSNRKSAEEKVTVEKVQKRYILTENPVQNRTEKPEVLNKLRNLISRYSIIQNTFINKIYKILSNMDPNREHRKVDKPVETTAVAIRNKTDVIQNKTETIQVYTRNIIDNLRKLRHLAQKLNSNVRRKRDAGDNDSVEYLLMLMEYLMKQNHQSKPPPVNDGIDLIIEAIKSAPDIKPIQKKVLEKPYIVRSSPRVNVSRRPSLFNSISKPVFMEKKSMINHDIDNVMNSIEEEDEDDRSIIKKEVMPSKQSPESAPTTHNNDLYDTQQTLINIDTFRGPNFKLPSNEHLEVTKPNITSVSIVKNDISASIPIDNKLIVNSNETDNVKYELYNIDEEETTTAADFSVSTHQAPTSSAHYDKKFLNFKSEDLSGNLGRSKLDWLDESYEEEIISEIKKATSTNKPSIETSSVTATEHITLAVTEKQFRRSEDVSDVSKEVTVADLTKTTKKDSTEEILAKKETELMNSLDYGTEKIDTSMSKENSYDDKYSGSF